MISDTCPLAIVTGALSGISYKAKCSPEQGFDLLIAVDQLAIHGAAPELCAPGVAVEAVQADLATLDGVDRLSTVTKGKPVEALLANTGHGLGHAFLEQDFNTVQHIIWLGPGGLQRYQGIPQLLLVRAAGRAERPTRDGHVPDAERH